MSEELFGMEGIPEGIPSLALPAGPSVDPQFADDVSAAEPPEEDWESFIGDAPYPTPNLTGQRKGRRSLVPPPSSEPVPDVAPERRLLILDTWRRSGLPAGDFATLVRVSKHTLYAWKKRFEEEGPGGTQALTPPAARR